MSESAKYIAFMDALDAAMTRLESKEANQPLDQRDRGHDNGTRHQEPSGIGFHSSTFSSLICIRPRIHSMVSADLNPPKIKLRRLISRLI